MRLGDEEAHNDYTRRITVMIPGPGRVALEQMAEFTKPIDRQLLKGEILARIGEASRDLVDRAFVVGRSSREPIIVRGSKAVEDIDAVAYDISGSWISPFGVVALNDTLFLEDFRHSGPYWQERGWPRFTTERIGISSFNKSEGVVTYIRPDTATVRDDKPTFLFDSAAGCINFAHFLHDTLCQILSYDVISSRLGVRPRPILARDFLYPAQRYIFERLVCPLSETIALNGRGLQTRSCFTSSRALFGWEGRVSSPAMCYLRERLLSLGSFQSGTKKVYINRSDSKVKDSRIFRNISDLENMLNDCGFESITVGALEPFEIIEVFSQAQQVVGIHGAGILNAMLSPAGVHVVEIWPHQSPYRALAMTMAACGIDQDVVRAIPPTSDTPALIDVAAVGRCVIKDL